VPFDGLLSHTVRLDGTNHTQAIFVARHRESHASVCQALEEAGLVPGRVAFAGQLALQALRWRCEASGWTIVPEVTFAHNCLLVQGPDGQLVTNALPSDEGCRESARELLRSWLPKMESDKQPLDLSAPPAAPHLRLKGPALSAPLDFLVPVFLDEPDWRLASQEDRDFPLYFGHATWGFAAALLVLLLWTGSLVWQLADIASTAGEVGQLSAQKATLSQSQSKGKAQLAVLERLAGNLADIGAEVYDNAAWLHWLGSIRDRSASALLFASVAISGRIVSLTGRHEAAEPVLAFFKALTRLLGEQQAQFQNVTRVERGAVVRLGRLPAEGCTCPRIRWHRGCAAARPEAASPPRCNDASVYSHRGDARNAGLPRRPSRGGPAAGRRGNPRAAARATPRDSHQAFRGEDHPTGAVPEPLARDRRIGALTHGCRESTPLASRNGGAEF
jgi:hypothetical protein